VILSSGAYWFVFAQENNPDVIGGILQGTGTSDNGSFMSSDGKVFDVDAGIFNVTVSATYVEKETLSGTLSGSTAPVPFNTQYNSLYDMTPSLSIIAGSYVGEVASASGREFATVTVSSTGSVSGNSASGCRFTGTASVNVSGNVYDLSVTFQGDPCDLGSQTVNGIAVFDTADNELIAATVNTARDNGFVYIGSGGGSGGGGTPADIAGMWSVTDTITSNTCDSDSGSDTYDATITQSGSAVTFTDDELTTVDGTLAGNQLTLSDTFSDADFGTVTVSGTLDFSGNSYSGTYTLSVPSCMINYTSQGSKIGG
jgi:hypothetical protein